jgi:hypothetical protein
MCALRCPRSQLCPRTPPTHTCAGENRSQGVFDAVVISHNGKCANRLVGPTGAPRVAQQLMKLRLSAVWACMLALPAGLPEMAALEGAFVRGDPVLSWAANNTAKLQVGGGGEGGGKRGWGAGSWCDRGGAKQGGGSRHGGAAGGGFSGRMECSGRVIILGGCVLKGGRVGGAGVCCCPPGPPRLPQPRQQGPPEGRRRCATSGAAVASRSTTRPLAYAPGPAPGPAPPRSCATLGFQARSAGRSSAPTPTGRATRCPRRRCRPRCRTRWRRT